MPHPEHTLGAEGAHGRLHSSQMPRKCSCPGTLLMIPILGILAKVMIRKMGKAKGGLPTAYGTGPKLLTGGSSFTLPSNGQFLNTTGTSPSPVMLFLLPIMLFTSHPGNTLQLRLL